MQPSFLSCSCTLLAHFPPTRTRAPQSELLPGNVQTQGWHSDLLNLMRVLWAPFPPEQSYGMTIRQCDALVLGLPPLGTLAAGKGLLGFYLTLQSTEPGLS